MIQGILETALYADDLEASEQFYTSVLELAVYGRVAGRHIFFRCGQGMLLIFNPAHTAREQTSVGGAAIPLHGASGAGHMAFAVADADMAHWRARLQQQGVAIESEVDWPAGGHSIYLRDPAGNSVELASPRLWGLAEG
jgi:catechol 2,3-dioxygenase-like lactoylglutathione lyase family enzyme